MQISLVFLARLEVESSRALNIRKICEILRLLHLLFLQVEEQDLFIWVTFDKHKEDMLDTFSTLTP